MEINRINSCKHAYDKQKGRDIYFRNSCYIKVWNLFKYFMHHSLLFCTLFHKKIEWNSLWNKTKLILKIYMLQFLLNSKQPVPMNVRIPLEHLKLISTYIQIALINMFVSFIDFFFHYFQAGMYQHRKYSIVKMDIRWNTEHSGELIAKMKCTLNLEYNIVYTIWVE